MSTIILYIYLAICVMVYIFIQLNYMFVWFKKLIPNDIGALECVLCGLIVSVFWPIFVIIGFGAQLIEWMDNVHRKHNNN